MSPVDMCGLFFAQISIRIHIVYIIKKICDQKQVNIHLS